MYVCMYEFLLVQHYLMEDYYDVFKTLTVCMYVCMYVCMCGQRPLHVQ